MGFFLQVEVKSRLSLLEFRERVISPLQDALEREAVGKLLNEDLKELDTPEGVYELAIEVTDQQRAREIIGQVLMSVDDPAEPAS